MGIIDQNLGVQGSICCESLSPLGKVWNPHENLMDQWVVYSSKLAFVVVYLAGHIKVFSFTRYFIWLTIIFRQFCRSLPRVLQPLTSSSDQTPGKSRNNSPRNLTLRVLTTLHKWILVWLCSGRWGLLMSTFWCNFCSMNGLLVMLLHWWGILLYSSLSTSHPPPTPPTASFFSLFPYAFLYPRV